jgi:hypothetical protein
MMMTRLICQSASSRPQGFLVYPKYLYCKLVFPHEASSIEDEKDAIRVNQKALTNGAGRSHLIFGTGSTGCVTTN